jgi:hypothetical protein
VGTLLDGDPVFAILLWERIVPKVSMFFAVALFLAAGNFSPALASKCYGLDPCDACRNCHACKHCHVLGGKCGVCEKESNPKRIKLECHSNKPEQHP